MSKLERCTGTSCWPAQRLLLACLVLLWGISLAATPLAGQADAPAPKPTRPANRLAQETSPYLLLHAHNPVNWYPWGEEALARAKQENKPIFLSIGYASCHWCHVMERESFLDEEIAAFLNEHFVCIKVDREERPDIDHIYMTGLQVFHQLLGRPAGGGWPLTMFLTPEAEPFFGGTYFPARDGDREMATGLLTILRRVQEVWGENPERLRKDAATLARVTKSQLETQPPAAAEPLTREKLAEVQTALAGQYDAQHGGFGYDPEEAQRSKFPEPANLVFLLDVLHRADPNAADAEPQRSAREMLVNTLEKMSLGGIRDHLGGGFHRYSVDRYWHIPHFEKMLYDNGQLMTVYAEAYAVTGRDDFRRVAEEIAEFTLREMRDPGGAFYAALDAESEGEEGKFYRWDRAEVLKLLSSDEQKLLAPIYGFTGTPNFERQFYVPQLAEPLAVTAQQQGLTEAELEARLAPLRQKLFEARAQRARPLTDTKILASWNGLTITGFADLGRITKNPRYVEAATTAARFVIDKMRTSDGRMLASWSGGQAKLNGYLNDYAFVVEGLLALHRASGDAQWLETAQQLTDKQIELFWDEKQHGFYFTSSDHETLLARAKEFADSVQPSGNSVAAANLVYLAKALERDDYRGRARETVDAAWPHMARFPTFAPRMALVAAELLDSNAPAPAQP